MTKTRPEDLESGDQFLFNDRSVPCTVTESYKTENARFCGSIRIIYEVKADGPAGGDIVLQRTGTGRIRVQCSPGAPFANIQSLERVSAAETPFCKPRTDEREEAIREMAEDLL